jgi:hypothetical protein
MCRAVAGQLTREKMTLGKPAFFLRWTEYCRELPPNRGTIFIYMFMEMFPSVRLAPIEKKEEIRELLRDETWKT